MQKHVFFAMPTYTGQIHMETFRSLLANMMALTKRGDKFTLWDESGNAMIAHARDLVLAHFLASEATHCLFVDNDVVFPADSVLRLIDAPVDFSAVVYRQRKDPENYAVQWDTSKGELQAHPETGLLEVHGVPAGFMCLTRSCVERMTKAYEAKTFNDKAAPSGKAVALFDNIHDGTMYWGEDFSFCRRWREIGGKVWVDPTIRMGHIGNKMFTGSLGDWLISGQWREATSEQVAEKL
jgi:hypothetical protein